MRQRGVVLFEFDDFVEPEDFVDDFELEKVSRMLPIKPPDFG